MITEERFERWILGGRAEPISENIVLTHHIAMLPGNGLDQMRIDITRDQTE